MAQRFVRDSIWTSPTINHLSDRAELLFYRLLPLPDDHGCFLADPIDLKGLLFPRKPKWTIDVIRRQLTSLLEAGLIGLWVQEERLYGIFWKWEKYQRCRSKFARKTPKPPEMEKFSQKEHLDEVYKFLGFIDVNCRQLSSIGASSSSPSTSPSTSSSKEDMSPDKSGSPRLQKFYQAVIQIDYSKYKDLGLSKVDYDFEIKKMAGWIEANPRKGNKSNYGRFIHNWLIRRIEDGKQSKRGGREVDTFTD